MKAKKLIAATGLFILAALLIGSSTFAGGTGAANTHRPNLNQTVTYVVKVLDSESLHSGANFWIVLMDKDGAVIDKQKFNPGVFVYTFKEKGPVKESRSVGLSLDGRVYYAKASRPGPFAGGSIIGFDLVPIK